MQYATASGSATAGADHTTTSGTLTFVDGDADETISVPVLDDGAQEAAETFTVTLSAPVNGELDTPSTATVTIASEEALFVVTEGGDQADATPNGVCARAGGGCTLRAAIQEANADADLDSIVVADGVLRIELGAGSRRSSSRWALGRDRIRKGDRRRERPRDAHRGRRGNGDADAAVRPRPPRRGPGRDRSDVLLQDADVSARPEPG